MGENRNVDLPEELVHDILLRLPVKALLVCKCVCKGWCALITSPGFVNRHFSHESNQECLGFRTLIYAKADNQFQYAFAIYKDDENNSLVEKTNHPRKFPTDEALIGSEKGIFLVVGEEDNIPIGLFNPAMREFKRLPPLPLKVYLQIDWVLVGFGLDPSTGDFKVVAYEKSNNRAFVYCLSSDSWKKIETDLIKKVISFVSNRIPALKGIKHWLVKFDRNVSSILAFDLSSEKFQNLPIPDALATNEDNIHALVTLQDNIRLTAYGDSIAVMSYKKDECFDLWVMGRDGLWSKSFSIDRFQEWVWPYCVWKKKNKVFFQTGLSHSIMFDVSTKRARTLELKSHIVGYFTYKESLVSIKGERVDCIQDLI